MPVSAIATNAPPGTSGANRRTVATRGHMGDEQDKAGFRVTDRRRFAAEVAASPDEPTRDDPPASADPSLAHDPFEPVSFSTFVLGHSTQALLHLGEMANPESGKVEQDLGGAKHLIDILGILRDKTKNNLEQDEERLLDSVLYDLRMRYVVLVRGAKKEEA